MDLRLLASLQRQRLGLRRRDGWSRRQLESHQAASLRDLRDFAWEHSPFYRKRHAGLHHRPLHELPTVTKAELMAHFGDAVTDPALRLDDLRTFVETQPADAWLGDYQVASTSGTTGQRGYFPCNRAEWTAVLASYARANDWAGIHVGLAHPLRLAVVSSRAPWHQSARVGATLQSRLVTTLRLDASAPLDEIVTRLNVFQPESLVAYAGMARILAEEQRAGHLQVQPKAVMCASEVLVPATRRAVRDAFGVEPFEVYAATETAGIAADCERHRLHLFEDLVIAEPVDGDNRPVPPGGFADKLLVTVLFSRTLPLIRYELTDRVAWSPDTCPCGRPFRLLHAIEGRSDDVLTLPGVGGGTVLVHPVTFAQVLEPVPCAGWQVVQRQDALHVALLNPPIDFPVAEVAGSLRLALTRLGVGPVALQVVAVPELAKTAAGKSRLVQALPREAIP